MKSQTTISLLTLLNNVDELIRISQDRKNAKEVMKCLVVYANNHSFPIPNSKINNFYRVCIDSRPDTLSYLVHDIAKEIIRTDVKKEYKIKKEQLKKKV